MWIAILIVAVFAWFVLVEVVKDSYQKSKWRREDRTMAAYQIREAARMHAWNLADIDRTVQATATQMVRLAAEADGDNKAGTAVEVARS